MHATNQCERRSMLMCQIKSLGSHRIAHIGTPTLIYNNLCNCMENQHIVCKRMNATCRCDRLSVKFSNRAKTITRFKLCAHMLAGREQRHGTYAWLLDGRCAVFSPLLFMQCQNINALVFYSSVSERTTTPPKNKSNQLPYNKINCIQGPSQNQHVDESGVCVHLLCTHQKPDTSDYMHYQMQFLSILLAMQKKQKRSKTM